MTVRQGSPVLGGQSQEFGPYLPKGHIQLSVGYRGGVSRQHWTGVRRNHEIRSGVRNYQSIVDVTGTYQVTKQISTSLSVPWSWATRRFMYGSVPTTRNPLFRPLLRDPIRNRPIWRTHSGGIGDISLVARSWMLPTKEHPRGNFSFGFGLQFPSGDYDAEALFPEGVIAPVDISVQPGAGGLGLIGEVQAFKQLRNITLFGFGVYVAQPRNTNGTLRNGVLRNSNGNLRTPLGAFRDYIRGSGFGPAITNSVPDVYVGEVGAAIPVPDIRGLYLTTSARIEGTPPRDLIGGWAGFRRPGFELFAVPGVGYTRGRNNFTLQVPVRAVVNVMDAIGTPRREDSTMPDVLFLARYTRTF